jgi:hypothetical protein
MREILANKELPRMCALPPPHLPYFRPPPYPPPFSKNENEGGWEEAYFQKTKMVEEKGLNPFSKNKIETRMGQIR